MTGNDDRRRKNKAGLLEDIEAVMADTTAIVILAPYYCYFIANIARVI
jgi:hypothetical protein